MEKLLRNLLTSLNNIEVKGKDNLDVLLGCMMAIENAIQQLGKTEESAEGETEDA